MLSVTKGAKRGRWRWLAVVAILCTAVVRIAAGGDEADASFEPLVPAELPDGFAFDGVETRQAGKDGTWFDVTYVSEASGSPVYLSLHQYVGVDAADLMERHPGEPTQVRGRPGLCEDDEVLRWPETDEVVVAVGGAGLECRGLVRLAQTLRSTDPAEWDELRRRSA